MKRLFVFTLVLLFFAGCTQMRQKPDKVDPFEYMYPKKVEWDDPVQVLKSYYGAKKRGDWKKAFDICDFGETRSPQEIRQIKEDLKTDSVEWPERYKYHDWRVSKRKMGGETCVLLVTEMRSIHDPKRKAEMRDYEETMKLYGKKWKLVVPKVPEE